MAVMPIEVQKITTDVVVIGGGGAASRAALSARQAGADVHLVTKVALRAGGSTVHGASEIMSMGAAGFGDPSDSSDIHYQDTMRAGRGFIDPALVRVLADDAPERIRDLIQLGVPLDREGQSQYKLIKSDFGSYARALGVGGKTGKAFVEALTDEIIRLGVHVDANVSLVDLVRDEQGAIAGALCFDTQRQILIHYDAPSVILGTGGMHGAFEQQVSTSEMTGDGQAVAFRHGAELVNLEFHQFGPALVKPYVQLFSGSCFKLHPALLNREGEAFLHNYLPDGVTPEEVLDEKVFPFTTTNVSRYLEIAISREIKAGRGSPLGGVYISFAGIPKEKIAEVMPNTARWLGQSGVDLEKDRLEMGIAFQCMNGGVRMTGPDAQSSIQGLYVIGELAGGVRGPDRPGGNSLAEGQVFGHRSGVAAAARAAQHKVRNAPHTLAQSLDFLAAGLSRNAAWDHAEAAAEIRRTMQRDCLVEKDAATLGAALERIGSIRASCDGEMAFTLQTLVQALSVRNMAMASELVLRACLNREETRSSHYRVDFPRKNDDDYTCSFVMRRQGDQIALTRLTYQES